MTGADPGAPPGIEALPELRLTLVRDNRAPGIARAATRAWSESAGLDTRRHDTLVLLVSELVTNAALHSEGPADAPILLTVDLDGGVVRGAVTDAGSGFTPGRRRVSDPGGFGLYLVARESLRWGVDRIGATRVWFDL